MVPGREGAGEGGITFFRESVRNDLRKHRISRRTGKTPDIPTERLDAPRRDDFFAVSNGDGSFSLTVPGYVLVAVLIFALFVLMAMVASHGKRPSARQIAFASAAIALAVVTSMIKLFEMPFGGSVTLCSSFFIVLIAYWYGPAVGMMAGVAFGLLQFVLGPYIISLPQVVAFGLLQFVLGPYIISLPQVLFDYPLAFGALGVAGFFYHRKHGLLIGYIAGMAARLFFHVLSGIVFFADDAPAGMSALAYSLAYNGSFLAAEAAITILIMMIPAVSKALQQIRNQAVA